MLSLVTILQRSPRLPPAAAAISPRRALPVAWLCAGLVAGLLAGIGSAAAQVAPRTASTRDSVSVDRLLDEARRAAHDDRNRESAELFARVIAADPARRPALLMEYGDQLSYSGRAQDAVPLFREALARAEATGNTADRHRARLGLALGLSWSGALRAAQAEYRTLVASDANDREARLGLARVLAWRDRLAAATREYDVLLTHDPRDFEARRERTRVTSWRGRNRAAVNEAVALRGERPGDAQTALILTDAYVWSGRPVLARAVLDSALARSPGTDDLVARRAVLRHAVAGAVTVSNAHSRQSDQMDITTSRAVALLPLAGGQSSVEMVVEQQAYRPLAGAGVDVTEPGIAVRIRPDAGFEWNVNVFASRLAPIGGTVRWLGRGDTWITFWPSDYVRADIGVNRALLDNVRSLEQAVSVSSGSASVDLLPTEWAKVSVRVKGGHLSDDNSYRQGQVEAAVRPTTHPTLWFGARLNSTSYAHVAQNGYFSPTRFVSAMAMAHVTGVFARLAYDVDGSYGKEYSTPYGDKPAGSASARLEWPREGRLSVALVARTFSSKLASSSGFSRTTLGAEMHAHW